MTDKKTRSPFRRKYGPTPVAPITPLGADDLVWQDGTPVSPDHGDVYFSDKDGMAETDLVFIDAADLPSRLKAQTSAATSCVVAEMGFGTGLTFLRCLQLFEQLNPTGNLRFISCENRPLDRTALHRAHGAFPALADQSKALIDQLPPATAGFHQRYFCDGRVQLLLLYGEAETTLSQVSAQVDIWFLDGFAPAKNPTMWSTALFDQMARLSNQGAKLATFTAAGFVRRGLQAVGFSMEKRAGFGHKRERMIGQFTGKKFDKLTQKTNTIAVIGAGMAGAFLAYRLKQMGHPCTVINSEDHAKSSAVPAATLIPRFQLNDDADARFFRAAYDQALRHPALIASQLGTDGIKVKGLSQKDTDRLAKISDSYSTFCDWVRRDGETGSLSYPHSSAYDTGKLLAFLLDGIPQIHAPVAQVKAGDSLRWSVVTADGDVIIETDHLVFAGGAAMGLVDGLSGWLSPLDINPNRGQLVSFDDREGAFPSTHYAFDGGYLVDHGDSAGRKTLGSSYERDPDMSDWQTVKPSDNDQIITSAARALGCGASPPSLKNLSSFVGLRATSGDHLPVVGRLPNWAEARRTLAPLGKDSKWSVPMPDDQAGLYVITSFGSKGLQYGPISADIVASMITDSPVPVDREISKVISPLRFLRRRIIRGTDGA